MRRGATEQRPACLTQIPDDSSPHFQCGAWIPGKSGGARVAYLYVQARETIYLLLAFPKNVQANLTADQKKALRKLVAKLKKEA